MNIYIGWDSTCEIKYEVCKYSLIKSIPYLQGEFKDFINPLKRGKLINDQIYNRSIDKKASTEFSLTRFYVPLLNNFEGYSIFCDSDFLFLDNPLTDLIQNKDLYTKAVWVVKHDYTPHSTVKMNGKQNHNYPRKNWSSLILFNNRHPANTFLNSINLNNEDLCTPSFLHQFKWLHDDEIGELDVSWNWLVSYYSESFLNKKPKALHFTDGIPIFNENDVSYDEYDIKYCELYSQYFSEFCDKYRIHYQ